MSRLRHHRHRSRNAAWTFPGPASPGHTLSPLRRGGGDPCYLVTADGAIWRTSLMRSGPVTARICRSGARHHRLRGMGKRRNGIRRYAARAAGRRRRRDRLRPGRADHRRRPPAGAAPAAGPDGPGAGVADSGRDRTAGGRQGRVSGLAAAGHQVRRARARARRRRACGCLRPAMCGVASRRGSSTSRTSTPAGRAPSSVARSGRTRWSGWSTLSAGTGPRAR